MEPRLLDLKLKQEQALNDFYNNQFLANNNNLTTDITDAVRSWHSSYELSKYTDVNARVAIPAALIDRLMQMVSGYTGLQPLYNRLKEYKKNKYTTIKNLISLRLEVLVMIAYQERKYNLRRFLEQSYNDNYDTFMWMCQTSAGQGFPYSVPPVNLDRSWTVDGTTFTDLLNSRATKAFTAALSTVLIGMASGMTIDRIVGITEERMAKADMTNKSIVYNETGYFVNHAEYMAGKTIFDRYRYSAVLDNRTTTICRGLNGQIFRYSQAVVGINYPPMHNYCRSFPVPILDSMKIPKTAKVIDTNMGRAEFIAKYKLP